MSTILSKKDYLHSLESENKEILYNISLIRKQIIDSIKTSEGLRKQLTKATKRLRKLTKPTKDVLHKRELEIMKKRKISDISSPWDWNDFDLDANESAIKIVKTKDDWDTFDANKYIDLSNYKENKEEYLKTSLSYILN